MDFNTLHATIPYAKYGKEKSLEMKPYPNITLAMPGRHAEESAGGDFVVMVDSLTMKWKRHQFKHSDLFHDVQKKYDADKTNTGALMGQYYQVICGADPDSLPATLKLHGLSSDIFLRAIQCLAVAEHRRYHMHEAKFGGRYLPFRFVAGIAEGLWTAAAGTDVQKYGRPAVERLEKDNGVPVLTQKLMS